MHRQFENSAAPSSEEAEPCLSITIEAYSEGERRGLAIALLRQITPDLFELIPLYLHEISGPNIAWSSPHRGAAIDTTVPIRSIEHGRDALAWWATHTIAVKAALLR